MISFKGLCIFLLPQVNILLSKIVHQSTSGMSNPSMLAMALGHASPVPGAGTAADANAAMLAGHMALFQHPTAAPASSQGPSSTLLASMLVSQVIPLNSPSFVWQKLTASISMQTQVVSQAPQPGSSGSGGSDLVHHVSATPLKDAAAQDSAMHVSRDGDAAVATAGLAGQKRASCEAVPSPKRAAPADGEAERPVLVRGESGMAGVMRALVRGRASMGSSGMTDVMRVLAGDAGGGSPGMEQDSRARA